MVLAQPNQYPAGGGNPRTGPDHQEYNLMITNDPTRPGAPRPNPTKPDGSGDGPRPKTPHVPTDLRWIDELRPRPRTERWRWAIAGTGTTACAVLAAGLTLNPAASAARLAPEGCAAVQVQPGDTVWAIARANGLTLDQISERNPHIDDLSRVHPGDEIVVSCDPADPVLAPPVSVVNVDQWLGEREADGRLTWRSAVAHLYAQGMRGDDLITLAAISECESGRWSNAVGDSHLTNGTWSSSYGVWQIRSLRAQAGTGGPRDAEALAADVGHQAWAAVEVWQSSGPRAWTCWRNGAHLGAPTDAARTAAAEIGIL